MFVDTFDSTRFTASKSFSLKPQNLILPIPPTSTDQPERAPVFENSCHNVSHTWFSEQPPTLNFIFPFCCCLCACFIKRRSLRISFCLHPSSITASWKAMKTPSQNALISQVENKLISNDSKRLNVSSSATTGKPGLAKYEPSLSSNEELH